MFDKKKCKIGLKKKKKRVIISKKFERGVFVQIYKVVGVNSYDFDNPKGDHVSGSTYHLLSLVPSSSERFSGYAVEKQSVFSDKLDGWARAGSYIPVVGSIVMPIYSKSGTLDSFIDPVAVGIFTPSDDKE